MASCDNDLAAERCTQGLAKRQRCLRRIISVGLGNVDIGQANPVQFPDQPQDGVGGLGIVHPALGDVGRKADTRATGTLLGGDRFGHFDSKTDAVFGAAAIGIGAVVGTGAQEFIDQVAVGGMNLDPIETGCFGISGGLRIISDDPGDLGHLQSARHRAWHHAAFASLGIDDPDRGVWREGGRRIFMRFGADVDRNWPFVVDDRLQGLTVRGDRIANDGDLLRRSAFAGLGIACKAQ
jgi:hypothetical protein